MEEKREGGKVDENIDSLAHLCWIQMSVTPCDVVKIQQREELS